MNNKITRGTVSGNSPTFIDLLDAYLDAKVALKLSYYSTLSDGIKSMLQYDVDFTRLALSSYMESNRKQK